MFQPSSFPASRLPLVTQVLATPKTLLLLPWFFFAYHVRCPHLHFDPICETKQNTLISQEVFVSEGKPTRSVGVLQQVVTYHFCMSEMSMLMFCRIFSYVPQVSKVHDV